MSENFNAASQNRFFIFNSKKDYLPWLLIFAVVVLSVLQLWNQGRFWWCQTGDYAPWSWAVWSPHNSQHVIDPYTFTHILHGILFFWIASLIFRKMPLAWRLLIAITVESAWEVVENTDMIINRYREATISLDYFGDSVLNSVSDVSVMMLGFALASRLPLWLSVTLIAVMELGVGYMIRDNLTLNILMLLYPIDAIREWQAGR